MDRYLAEQFMPENFWLHRVNSLGKQREFFTKYNGLEFDVIFYEQEMAFENSHDPVSLHKYNLEKQLRLYKELGGNKGIWLDFKNLNAENKLSALETLEGLLAKTGVPKQRIWLESRDWRSLKVFKDAGYKTSYYFPYYDFASMSPERLAKVKSETVKASRSGNVDAISFYWKYYDFVSSLAMADQIVFLTWIDGSEWSEVMLMGQFEKIVNDKRVNVILVKDKGHHTR